MILVAMACKNEVVSHTVEQVSFQLINTKNIYFAGESIQIQFTGNPAAKPYLLINNAFGSTILQPTTEENQLTYRLPKLFSEKSGICTWRLVGNNSQYTSGKITIQPNDHKNKQIESYLGPPSITAGEIDYTMLVTAPVDIYDNPLMDSTLVSIKNQFNTTIEETTVSLKNGIAWKNLHSPKKSGRLLIAASSDHTASKELTAKVYPANATDFNIDYQSNHNFADGNQVITFSTDIIKDAFENSVSDGTLVTFTISDSKGMRLQTNGTTINGIAKASLLHPDEPAEWLVTAYVTGAAKSNTITLSFNAALKDYEIAYSNGSRTISISQMQSFMEQLIPDGMTVTLEIRSDNGVLLETLRTTSRLGKAQFSISKDFYPNASYGLTIRSAGIVKTKTVQLQ